MSNGFKFFCDLPDWADKYTKICHFKNEIIVFHPQHAPHYYDRDAKKWIRIKEVTSETHIHSSSIF